jgi:DNA invertase Pin-like site-specific DNA recombinase
MRRQGGQNRRYRRCLDCGHTFVTVETYAKPIKPPSPYRRPVKRGEDSNLAVLTEGNVLDIRRLALDTTYADIAKQYGIHKDTVYRIVNRKIWSHL